jgi:hypothetical protein
MPKLIHQETMCCGFKRCPEIRLYEDGSIELSDDDVEGGSIGTIKLKPEAAARLFELVSEQKEF